MYGYYKGVDSNNANAYDDLLEHMTIIQFRTLIFVGLFQFLLEIILYFPLNNMGAIEVSFIKYAIFFISIPTSFNVIILLLTYFILKKAFSIKIGVLAVSAASLALLSNLYFFHNFFNSLSMLFLVLLVSSAIYGYKKITLFLGIVGTILKILIDVFLRVGFAQKIYGLHISNDILSAESIFDNIGFIIIMSGVTAFCYMIINVEREKRLLTADIEKERDMANMAAYKERLLRDNSSKICEYVANVSTDSFVEGSELFLKLFNGQIPGYKECMLKSISAVVHPDDVSVFYDFSKPGYYEYMYVHSPKYSLRVRLSPKKVTSLFNLHEDSALRMLAKDDEWIFVSFNATIVTDKQDGNLLIYVEITDVNDIVKKEQAMLDDISHDALTGVYNRKAARNFIYTNIRNHVRGIMLIIDLDNFKSVNDNLGHPVGDRFLQESANIIKNNFSTDDIVCRLGGDEFLIFAPNMELNVAKNKASALLSALDRDLKTPDGFDIKVGASIGIAVFPDDAQEYEMLYSNADKALYEAKRNGKGTYVIYGTEKMAN